MFETCCEAPPACNAHVEIAQDTIPDEQVAPLGEAKQAEAAAVVVEKPAEPEQPAVVEQTTNEEVAEAVTETPAPKAELFTSVVDVVVEEEEEPKPAAAEEPAAKPTPATSKLEVTLQPGILGVKFDGVTVLEVDAKSQVGKAGLKKGHKVVTFGGENVPENATAGKLFEWLLEKLKAPRPVLVQFERPVLETTIVEGTLGVKIKGRTVIEVTPGFQADTAGVKVGYDLLSFGAEVVPFGKTEAQLAEWLQVQLAAPRPIVVQFEQA